MKNPINRTKRAGGKLGIVLCGVLLGCTTYGQVLVSPGMGVRLPSAGIHTESDFHESLTPLWEWGVNTAGEWKIQTPAGSEAKPRVKRTIAPPTGLRIVYSTAAAPEPAATAPKAGQAQSEASQSVAAAQSNLGAKAEVNLPAAIKEPAGRNANKQTVKQGKPAGEKPDAIEKSGPNPPDKDLENKSK